MRFNINTRNFALKIQSVFEEQSVTATDTVERLFAEILAFTVADTTEQHRGSIVSFPSSPPTPVRA